MPMKLRCPMPSLSGATSWIRGGPVENASLLGKVTLVHFWAVSCEICKPHLPKLVEWEQQVRAQGVAFVSVHMPRREEDTDVAGVEQAVEMYGLAHPTAVDNTHAITDLFGNEFVPAYYVFDREGLLRIYTSGEKVLPQVKACLDRLVQPKPAVC